MHFSSYLYLPLFISSVAAIPATAANGVIQFKQFALNSNLQFGIALPKTSTGKNDFIGQIKANGIGWGGISLGPSMLNYLMIVAEPGSSGVTGSLHRTSAYVAPAQFNSGVSITPIKSQSSVQGNNWTYTFVCTGCLAQYSNFTQTADSGVVAWAYGSRPTLSLHSKTGYSGLSKLSAARIANYAQAATSS